MGHNIKRNLMLMAAPFLAVAALAACLPDSNEVREKNRQGYLEAEVSKYASSMSSHSATVQNKFLNSAAWKGGTMTPGLLDEDALGFTSEFMDSAYCADTSVTPENHMLVVWMEGQSTARFALKGMGDLAGPQIVREIGEYLRPSNTGIYQDQVITLSGPRGNGGVTLALPGVCANLTIPPGAPVVVFEGLSIPAVSGAGDAVSYDYRTVECDNPLDLGGKTQRRAITANADGTQTVGIWEDYNASLCREGVGERTVSITDSQANTVSMLALLSGDINGTLSGLASMDCREAEDSSELPDGADGDDKITVNTCDAEGVTITKYEGLEEATLTGEIDSRVEISTACGAGSLGMIAGSYSGYAGTINPGTGWQGTATYERIVYDAVANPGDTGVSGDTGQRGEWRGKTLNCTRNETMTVGCYTVLPQYNGSDYVAESLGGFTFQRTNRIDGWADTVAFTPNASYGPSDNWSSSGVNCRWREQPEFTNCADGLSPDNTGTYQRSITATMPIGGVTEGPWEALNPSQCSSVDEDEDDCPPGEEGSITIRTVTTSTAEFPWSTPDVDSYTEEDYNCEPIPPEPPEPPEDEDCPTGNCHEVQVVDECPPGASCVEFECEGGSCTGEHGDCDYECEWDGSQWHCVECCD